MRSCADMGDGKKEVFIRLSDIYIFFSSPGLES